MKKIDGKIYMEDAHGSLIDASMVKPIDRLRDEVVCGVMERTFAERDSMIFHLCSLKKQRPRLSGIQVPVKRPSPILLHTFGMCRKEV